MTDRIKRGEDHPRAKLKAADIPAAREACRVRGGLARFAREHGVHPTTVRDIRDGRTWRSVPE